MTAPSWMPLYVADYLADTGHLSTVEHGAYFLLIMHYWQHGKLPSDDGQLARICRMPRDEWSGIRESMQTLFGAGWSHKRIDAELAKAFDLINKRTAAGIAGASARHGKSNGSRIANAQQSQTQPPSPTPKKDTSSLRSEGVADAPPDERTRLFREGVPAVSRITGKPSASARSLVARWLKLTGDDCIAVRRLVEDAERERPVEPVSWIEARLRPVQSTGPPRRAGNGFAAAGLELMEQQRERRRNHIETTNLNAEDRFP